MPGQCLGPPPLKMPFQVWLCQPQADFWQVWAAAQIPDIIQHIISFPVLISHVTRTTGLVPSLLIELGFSLYTFQALDLCFKQLAKISINLPLFDKQITSVHLILLFQLHW